MTYVGLSQVRRNIKKKKKNRSLFLCISNQNLFNSRFQYQVIVKNLASGARVVLKSHYGYEVLL